MLCQYCKQHTATIHLTEITDGHRSEAHLCEKCAQQQGIAIKNQIPLNELLSSLLSAQSKAGEPQETGDDISCENECPSCGMTMGKFQKTSLLGCPEDYYVFKDQLDPLIEKTQAGHLEHSGKTPSKAPEEPKKHMELVQLRKLLDEAVKKEDYETAAVLRDKISELQ